MVKLARSRGFCKGRLAANAAHASRLWATRNAEERANRRKDRGKAGASEQAQAKLAVPPPLTPAAVASTARSLRQARCRWSPDSRFCGRHAGRWYGLGLRTAGRFPVENEASATWPDTSRPVAGAPHLPCAWTRAGLRDSRCIVERPRAVCPRS